MLFLARVVLKNNDFQSATGVSLSFRKQQSESPSVLIEVASYIVDGKKFQMFISRFFPVNAFTVSSWNRRNRTTRILDIQNYISYSVFEEFYFRGSPEYPKVKVRVVWQSS